MSNRNNSGVENLPIISLVAVLTAAGVGAYLYFNRGFSVQEENPWAATQVVPESAFATSYLSTDAQDWKFLSAYGTPEAQQTLQKGLDQWKQEVIPSSEINFEQDILPWIDGVTLAVLPPNSTATTTEKYQLLSVVGIKDKIKAAQFAKKLEKQPGITTQQRRYQGITITQTTERNSDRLIFFAVVGDRIVLATESQTVEQAIDTFKGKPSYAKKPGVKELFSRTTSLKRPLIQVYFPDYVEGVKQLMADADRELPAATLKELNALESVVMGIEAKKEGLHLQAIANLNPNAVESPPKPIKSKVLSQFPGETLAFVNGQGINLGWSQLVKQSEQDPEIKTLVTQVREGVKIANLNADQDVFSWLDGEFALGILKLPRGGIANLGIGGMIMVETSDRQTGENTLGKLDKIAQSTRFIQLDQQKIGKMNVTQWKIPQQGVMLSYTWAADHLLMLTLGTSFETVQEQQGRQSLPHTTNFLSTKTALPSNNLGYVYLDVEQTTQKLSTFPGNTIPPETQAILSSLQGLGMTVTLPNNTTSQIDLVLSLKSEN